LLLGNGIVIVLSAVCLPICRDTSAVALWRPSSDRFDLKVFAFDAMLTNITLHGRCGYQ
jgi:hypothetical protein